MTSHLDDGIIQELVDGEIPSANLPPIREHLANCAECRARLDAAQAMTDEVDELITALDDPPPVTAGIGAVRHPVARERPWIRNAAWAASLILAVSAGYFARGGPPVPTVGTTEGATALRVPDTSVVSATVPDSAAPPPAPARGATANRAAPPTAGSSAGDLAARDARERTDAALEDRATREAAPAAQAPAVAPPVNGAARRLPGEGVTIEVPDPMMRRTLNQARAADMVPQVTSKQGIEAAGIDTISFTDAVRRLGGRLLLIDGMVPARLEAEHDEVRVVYRVGADEVVLVQSVRNGVVTHRLRATPGFDADTLAAMQRRVKG